YRHSRHRPRLLSHRRRARPSAQPARAPIRNMTTPNPLLHVQDLSVVYRAGEGAIHAVQDVTLSLERGRSLGLVGESGSGKSTVADAILRLLPENARITSGSIVFDGTDLAELSDRNLDRLWRWRQ